MIFFLLDIMSLKFESFYTGRRKWKSNYPNDKEVLDLIRGNAQCHRFWVAIMHGIEGQGACHSYNQVRYPVRSGHVSIGNNMSLTLQISPRRFQKYNVTQ